MTLQQDRIAEDEVTKLLDIDASDRVQILSAPVELPGVCGLCGTSRTDDRSYVDIGLWLEFYGHFYFCTFCMTQFTNRLGGLTPEQAEDLRNELEQARQTILDFQNEKAALDGAINTLRNTGLFSGIDLAVVGSGISVVSKQDAPKFIVDTQTNKHTTVSSTDDSTESATEQRPNDVPSTSGHELNEWL